MATTVFHIEGGIGKNVAARRAVGEFLLGGERGTPQVGVQQHPGAVHDPREQGATEVIGSSGGTIGDGGRVALGDRRSSDVDQQRMGQPGVAQ